jgi:hypothetical protein
MMGIVVGKGVMGEVVCVVRVVGAIWAESLQGDEGPEKVRRQDEMAQCSLVVPH